MTKLKFDLARFDAGELPARTRDGRRVLHVHNSGLDCKHPIVAWVEDAEVKENVLPFSYRADGRVYAVRADGRDLVHETRMQKIRVVVYRALDGGIRTVSEDEVGDFERFCSNLRAEGQIFQLLEVEVPE